MFWPGRKEGVAEYVDEDAIQHREVPTTVREVESGMGLQSQ